MKLRIRFAIAALFAAQTFAQGTLADYQRSFAFRDLVRDSGITIAEPAAPIHKTDRFWYRRMVKGGYEFIAVDAATGTKSPAFDQARIAASLSAATGNEYKSGQLPFSTFDYTEDLKSIDFTAAEARWRVNLSTYACEKIPGFRDPRVIRSLPGPRLPESSEPVPSPDGKQEALIRNFNIWVRAKGAKEATPLSFDGTEGDYYALSLSAWSPDSAKLAAYRIRTGQRRKIPYVESSPNDQVQPKFSTMEYAKPGDALDIPRPVLFHVAAQKHTAVDPVLFPNPYSMSRIEWRKDSRAFFFDYNQRGHQVYRVIEVDATSGAARAIVNEESQTFFCYYSKRFVHHASDGKELIWMSERDGWNHLYLYDGVSGKVRNQITKGEWVVRSVAKVDDQLRQIWFSASGMHPNKDPYYLHWFRVNFDGTGLTPLTANPDANHSLAFTSDMKYFIDTFSRADVAPTSELRRASDLSVIARLEEGDTTALKSLGWQAPEPVSGKARDGKTDIWGVIYRPTKFDPTRKYPVIEYIYAGPHDSFVPKSFAPAHAMQSVAELGFVVVQVDGMGTSNRSKSFHDVCWKSIGDAGFPDRVLFHQHLAHTFAPWYDVSRLGIFGHSAGGQNAMRALLFHGDLYKVAASSAGCHDNRMDKISWNEQWMGWPVGPEYAASSNVEHAGKLQGKLLLAVGEMDTNVDPASTLQVVNALIRANKTFDLLVLPGRNHGGWGDYWDRKRSDFFVRELMGVQPPDWNVVKPPVSSTP